jgi:uncharacterized protein DUF4328
MTNRVWTLAAVAAATTSALLAAALMGLQTAILFDDLARKSGTPSTLAPVHQLQGASSQLILPYIVVDVLALALFFVWMNRIYQKLPGLGARDLQGSPGGAVGWWFVPIANLYKPFQYLREIWRALTPGLTTNDSSSRAKVSGGTIVGALWTLAILTFALGLVGRKAGQSVVTLDDFIRLRAVTATLFATRLLYWASSIALILAVRAREAELYAHLQARATQT